MTNLESFNKALIIQDDSVATIILESKSIDPTLEDDNAVSFAWGLIYSVTSPDYTQGKTSEKFTTAAITQRLKQGKDILNANGIAYQPFGSIDVEGGEW